MSKEKCRVCLINKGLMINMFTEKNSKDISTKIMFLCKIQIYPEDGLPNTICRKCLKKLDRCMEFVKLCQDSDLKLRTLLDQNVIKHHLDSYVDIELQNDSSSEEIYKYSPKHDTLKDTLIAESIVKTTKSISEAHVKNEIDTFCDSKTKYGKKMEKQQCFTCGKVMSSRFRLQTHLRTHTGERPFACPHCGKNFALAQSLKVHLRIHTGEKPLSCSECGAAFAHSAGLAAHRRKHSGQTPYPCALCPRAFRTIGHLQYHIRRHTGEKNFECDTCSRAFIARGDLKKHLLSHSGEKPHVCCQCGVRVSRASHLRRHIKYIHNGDKPFTCPQCPSKFSNKAGFEKHKTKHEEDKTLPITPQKSIAC